MTVKQYLRVCYDNCMCLLNFKTHEFNILYYLLRKGYPFCVLEALMLWMHEDKKT